MDRGVGVLCTSMSRVNTEEPSYQLEEEEPPDLNYHHPHQLHHHNFHQQQPQQPPSVIPTTPSGLQQQQQQTQQCYLQHQQDVKTMFINRNHLYSISPQLNFCPIYESIYGNSGGHIGVGNQRIQHQEPQIGIEPGRGEEDEEFEEEEEESRREHGVPAFYKDIILVKEKKRRKKGKKSALVFIFIFLLIIFAILAFFLFFFQVSALRKFDKSDKKLVLREEIGGEFRINNRQFEKSLKNRKSLEYLSFSQSFANQFDIFIKSSQMSLINYNFSQVIKVRKGENFGLSGIIVEFVIYLKQAASPSTVKTFIQTFIRVLEEHNGYIGKFLVDLRTVKFYGEDDDETDNEVWGPWSEWSTCLNDKSDCDDDRIKSRRKKSAKGEKIEISDCLCEVCTSCKTSEICLSMKGERAQCVSIKHGSEDLESSCGGHCTDLDSDERLACRYTPEKGIYECYENENVCLESKEWTCADGLCIPLNKRCDGHFNCYDSSDEFNCTCGGEEFHCGNNTSCVSIDKRCNNYIDCWDGSDELNCTA